ncbi:hypothetical protein PCANC_08271 [Puccinia coronata f. sp. avenae]|uniref:DUF7872 domain-containing protein n=1 Tax=Puccinia coronata f. sp. avenae TaxID=200324 RepID=A0A2N5T0T0_9BASI|nr:hypothetical protein PCANC_08271 [Puccinia coronata f. sp. avenae]
MCSSGSTSMRFPVLILRFSILAIMSTRLQVLARSSTAAQQVTSFELDPCGANTANFTLTPELWQSAQMDDYIAKHPLTQNSTISQFAYAIGMPNFNCGIGASCEAGQICYPAIGKDYLILYAVQQWNNFMNQLYRVVASITMMLSDNSAVMVTDFVPEGMQLEKSLFGTTVATLVIGVVAMFTAPLAALFAPVEIAAVAAMGAAEAATAATAAKAASAAAMAAKTFPEEKAAAEAVDAASMYQLLGKPPTGFPAAKVPKDAADGLKRSLSSGSASSMPHRRLKRDLLASRSLGHRKPHRLEKRGPPNIVAYGRWSMLDIHLGGLRTRLQSFVSLTVKTALATPIYSDAGLAPIIMQGVWFAPNPTYESMAEDTKKLSNIVLLSELFVSLGFVATIGQEPCKFEGPGGAWGGDEVLSHCDAQGVMRSIVMVKGDNLEYKIRNAALLRQKYHYEVYDLVTRAADCQAKFGVYGSNT